MAGQPQLEIGHKGGGRRRPVQLHVMARTPMESPCVNICKLDKAGRICTGCGRTTDEIRRWAGMSKAQRRAIMERLKGFSS
ncbi:MULTISPECIES: DUF1289 domain-containing protein [Sphingobium]|nr:DUF1289 domain-containing protein [Sphingobium sp. RSMS]